MNMVKEQIAALVEQVDDKRADTVPATLVPTPTAEYRTLRKLIRTAVATAVPSQPHPLPLPILTGPRILMWKQDPSVGEIGIRKAFLPGLVAAGPKDARIDISITGMPPVSPNV